MTEPLLTIPSGGWTVDDLDAFPESHYRHELTDGALTISPSRSSLHQALTARHGDRYQMISTSPRLSVDKPFAVDIPLTELLPRWAGRGTGPIVPEQGL